MPDAAVPTLALFLLLQAPAPPQSPPPSQATPPRLVTNLWPGAVTTVPRPRPDAVGVPLRTTLFFEIEPGKRSDGGEDPLDVDSLRVALRIVGNADGTAPPADATELVLLEPGRKFVGGASGTLFEPGPTAGGFAVEATLAVHLVPGAPLRPMTTYEVALALQSDGGVALPRPWVPWRFTTRAAPGDEVVELRGNASATIPFAQRIFSGTLKPSFDTSIHFDQLATYERMAAATGPPPRPAVGSLQRDWPLCGDYWTNAFFDGDPNFVRERETRRIVQMTDVTTSDAGGGGNDELELIVGELPEAPLYGPTPPLPLAVEYPAGCRVLVVDDEESRPGTVIAVDDLRRAVRVRVELDRGGADGDAAPTRRRRAADWHLFEPPPIPPDSVTVPGNFAVRITCLKKLDPPGTPVYWFARIDHEWDLVHSRFGRRLVVNFDRVPCDLSVSGVPGRVEPPKSRAEWQQVVRTVTDHLIQRYGRACLDWYWSVCNEPDLRPIFWRGDDAALLAFYDATVEAILQAFERRGLPADRVIVGGLELGALAPEPDLLRLLFEHCSPRRNGGRAIRCDFVSLHQYKHASAALTQLAWARRLALEIDPDYFKDLRVVAFESDPDWNPTRDPATRDMFLGNGFWPAWAADWMRRAIELGWDDPGFRTHEALLTVWPLDSDLAGIPALATVVAQDAGAGAVSLETVGKDILNFLECIGRMSTEYFLLEAANVDATVAAATLAPTIAGFGAIDTAGVALLIYGHDPLDPENRDGREVTVRIALSGLPFPVAPADVEIFELDADHGSFFREAQRLRAAGRRAPFTADEVAALRRAAVLPALDWSRFPVLQSYGSRRYVTLELPVPTNGIRFVVLRARE